MKAQGKRRGTSVVLRRALRKIPEAAIQAVSFRPICMTHISVDPMRGSSRSTPSSVPIRPSRACACQSVSRTVPSRDRALVTESRGDAGMASSGAIGALEASV